MTRNISLSIITFSLLVLLSSYVSAGQSISPGNNRVQARIVFKTKATQDTVNALISSRLSGASRSGVNVTSWAVSASTPAAYMETMIYADWNRSAAFIGNLISAVTGYSRLNIKSYYCEVYDGDTNKLLNTYTYP